MKSKFSLFLISLLAIINPVKADSPFWEFELNFWFIKDVKVWVLIITFGIVFMLLYKLISKLPMFKGDNKNSAILAVLIALGSTVGSPLATWMMITVALSPFIIFGMFIILILWTAISFFHKGVAEGHSRIMDAHKDWKKDRVFYKKEQKQAQRELDDLDDVIGEVKEADKNKDSPDFNDMVRDAISHLEHIRDQINRSIQLEKKRFKAEHDSAIEELKDLARKIRADIDDALDALYNKRPGSAEGDLQRAKKKLKRWKKESRKLLKEGRANLALTEGQPQEEEGTGDPKEIIQNAKKEYEGVIERLKSGEYTQEQAQDWQQKIWGEFFRDMRKIGFDDNQINEFWEKEIWSQGHVQEAAEEGEKKQEPQKLLGSGKLDDSLAPFKEQYEGVIERLKSGEYTQEQAQDWQQKIWGEFFRDMRKQGYNDDQINEFWEKEIWSQGHEEMSKAAANQVKQREDWQKMIQKKVNNMDSLFKVDLSKHPKKAKNYLRDIRKDIDQNLMDAATSLGQNKNLESYIVQLDQILDFFEHQKKPHEANQEDWNSIFRVAEAYKNFLLSLRDNI